MISASNLLKDHPSRGLEEEFADLPRRRSLKRMFLKWYALAVDLIIYRNYTPFYHDDVGSEIGSPQLVVLKQIKNTNLRHIWIASREATYLCQKKPSVMFSTHTWFIQQNRPMYLRQSSSSSRYRGYVTTNTNVTSVTISISCCTLVWTFDYQLFLINNYIFILLLLYSIYFSFNNHRASFYVCPDLGEKS